MKILALECSATAASAALCENGKIISSSFVNIKLTHSQTLLPMVQNTLSAAKCDINEVEGVAVSSGPGSFTGVRIGISAAKGIAAPGGLPCVGVSTLLSMAYNLVGTDCTACAVMDARCGQLYNAIFDITDGRITRICDDRAVTCEELEKEIKKMSQNTDKRVIIVGDGTNVFLPFVCDLPGVLPACEALRYQNAVSVALAADEMFKNGETVTPDGLLPVYLRLPQAQRELKLKKEGIV